MGSLQTVTEATLSLETYRRLLPPGLYFFAPEELDGNPTGRIVEEREDYANKEEEERSGVSFGFWPLGFVPEHLKENPRPELQARYPLLAGVSMLSQASDHFLEAITRHVNRKIDSVGAKTVQSLREFVDRMHVHACSHTPLSNEEVILLLEVDLLIRKAARNKGNEEWNDRYFHGNLESVPGNDVIEKTGNYIGLLKMKGLDQRYEGYDFALRNVKHVFDAVPAKVIEGVLPEIRKLLGEFMEKKRALSRSSS